MLRAEIASARGVGVERGHTRSERMFTRTAKISAAVGVLLAFGTARGVVTEYTVEATWLAAADGVARVINFDDEVLAQGGSLSIVPNRYAALPGAPNMVGVPSFAGSGAPWILHPPAIDITNGVIPTSGQNVLELTSVTVRNGSVRITFNRPVVAISGKFIDIETAASGNASGFRIAGSLAALNSSGPNGTAKFFGVVSTVPFTSVDLELSASTDPNLDGLAFDDLKWVLYSDCVGDVNSDGATNVADFNIIALNFATGSGKTRAQGDLSGDGLVSVADFNLLAGDFACID